MNVDTRVKGEYSSYWKEIIVTFLPLQIEKPIALEDFPEDDAWTKETEGVKPSNYPVEKDSNGPSKVSKNEESYTSSKSFYVESCNNDCSYSL